MENFHLEILIQVGENEIENMSKKIFKREIDPFTAIETIIKQ